LNKWETHCIKKKQYKELPSQKLDNEENMIEVEAKKKEERRKKREGT